MAKKSKRSAIKCRATRRHLLNGTETENLQGIRVTIAFSQKRTLRDMAESINYASSATVADVLAVWSGMEEEIIRTLSNGNRVELGSLGTLSLEVGTERRKSIKEGITSKDIVAKGITFTPSKRLNQAMDELTFECDGIVSHPLNEARMLEALEEYFAQHQYITVRTFATLCKCSSSTADRRIKSLIAQDKLRKSNLSSQMYEWVGDANR
mgnify:CR=1 FL=1